MNASDDLAAPPVAPAGPGLRLLVVDADRRVRSSLVELLDLAEQVRVVESAGHARAALDACAAGLPDAVIIDPRLPELPDGIDVIRRLRAQHPGVGIVVLAWAPGLEDLLADDAGISVVGPDGGELGDRILEALRHASGDAAARPGAGARLEPPA